MKRALTVHGRTRDKVAAIFKKLAGKRARDLEGGLFPDKVRDRMAKALAASYGKKVAELLAFHLVDWISDAAFLVAVLLYPERFTPSEISAGIHMLMAHVPHHILAAARLGGFPATDLLAAEDRQRLEGKRGGGKAAGFQRRRRAARVFIDD